MSIRTIHALPVVAAVLLLPFTGSTYAQNPKGECNSEKKQELASARPSPAENKNKTSTTSGTVRETEKEASGADKNAMQVNKEIVENAKPGEDGEKVAATGPAKPKENWFGCPPD